MVHKFSEFFHFNACLSKNLKVFLLFPVVTINFITKFSRCELLAVNARFFDVNEIFNTRKRFYALIMCIFGDDFLLNETFFQKINN